MKKVFSIVALSAIALIAFQSFNLLNAGYKIGDIVADFNLKGIDKKMVSLSDLKDNKGAIVIFTCNHCPFSVAYEDRIIALHNTYASKGFPVVAINPNDSKEVPEDSFKNMIRRAKEKQFPFVYLHDGTQQTARTYGAVRTPHVYLLSKLNNQYRVEYIGAIDNNSHEPELVTEKYVEKAIEELLAEKEITVKSTKAIGCSIKWKK